MSREVLRISPTILNRAQSLFSGDYAKWGKTTGDFISELITRPPRSPAMDLGRAYGLLLEHGPQRYRHSVEVKTEYGTSGPSGGDMSYDYDIDLIDAYRVTDKDMKGPVDFYPLEVEPVTLFREIHPYGAYEIESQLEFRILGFDVQVGMYLDHIDGLNAYEFKTSRRRTRYRSRLNAWQWRCYLAANPELVDLTYVEFQFERERTEDSEVRVQEFRFEPYQGMLSDVEKFCTEVVDWLRLYPEAIAARTRMVD